MLLQVDSHEMETAKTRIGELELELENLKVIRLSPKHLHRG